MLSISQKSEIIGCFMQGFTRDEIVQRTNVSTGAVSNTIHKWKIDIQAPDLEEIRNFMKLFRKAGMTLSECAEGLRTSKLLHKMEIIKDGDFDENEKNFFKFINDFYHICQTHQISPQILESWVNDLVNFTISKWNEDDAKNNNSTTQINTKREYPKMFESIPLTAMISHHIEKKKKESNREIKVLETQRERSNEDLLSQAQKRNHFVSAYDSFTKLERILNERYNIDLKMDLELVVNLFSEFMKQGYNLSPYFKYTMWPPVLNRRYIIKKEKLIP